MRFLISLGKVFQSVSFSASCWLTSPAGAGVFSIDVLTRLASAQHAIVKPGWNVFSAEQDVEIGCSVAAAAEQQLPMLNDVRVDAYLNWLGRRLAEKAPGEKYSYQFKAVNDKTINAFALRGEYRSPPDIPTAVRVSHIPCL